MHRPKLLDLFCGAGGAGMGYHRAGFDVTGVDLAPQKRYPFTFIQDDALEYLAAHGHEYDAIHASPPCQHYSRTRQIHPERIGTHADLVAPTRVLLHHIGAPYIIENVPGAPLIAPKTLCGLSFDLCVYRHRLFESNLLLLQPSHRHHPAGRLRKVGRSGHQDGDIIIVAGHFADVGYARRAMGIDWMTRDELSQAIPPAYAEFIGRQLLAAVSSQEAA
jgi:DNA (cytosine-5)-methyltransferase 1